MYITFYCFAIRRYDFVGILVLDGPRVWNRLGNARPNFILEV